MSGRKMSRVATFLRMARYIRPYAPRYVGGLLATSLMGFLQTLLYALGFKFLIGAVQAGDMGAVARTSLLLLALICVLSVVDAVAVYLVYANYRSIGGGVRKEVFRHVERLPMRFVEGSHSGDLLSRINNDMWRSVHMLGDPVSILLGAVLSGTLSGVAIFALDGRLGGIALGIGFLATGLNLLFLKPVKEAHKATREKASLIFQTMTDTIMGSQVVKIFNLQPSFVRTFQDGNQALFRAELKVAGLEAGVNGLNSFSGYLSYVGILVAGSLLVLNGRTDFGTLVAVVQLTGTFFVLFQGIGNFLVRVNGGLASAERLFETLDEPDEDQLHRARAAERAQGEAAGVRDEAAEAPDEAGAVPIVEFRAVDFRYKDRAAVLEGFDLSVYKDQVVAVVGSSGSGKSTLFKILLGFFEPDAGDVRFFGRSSLDSDLRETRSHVGYVPQDSYLFSGTVRDNIRWGRATASDEEIEAAARSAHAHDFILRLPQGYGTEVGERGARLSGGERQRVAIARALLKDAPILLLDEATSSLDSDSERQVQQALEVLMQGRTTLVIAHRLSTIRHADRIIVMENGTIVEDGTHEALIERNGTYARLYDLQFEQEREARA